MDALGAVEREVQAGPASIALSGPLRSIIMRTPAAGWAVTQGGQVLRTTSGGLAWQDVTPKGMPQGASGNQYLLAATDQSHAWVAFNSVSTFSPTLVYYTSNGGRGWQTARTGQAGALQLEFLNARTGFLLTAPQGGSAGSEWVNLLGTTDGGRNWRMLADGRPTPSSITYPGDKSGFTFLDAENGWMTGNSGAVPIMLYVTHDGGAAWRPEGLPVPRGFSNEKDTAQSQPPFFFGPSDGVMPVWFFSRGSLMDFYRTVNGGRTWTPTTPLGSANAPFVYSVIDPEHIVIAFGSRLYRTEDGGLHWSQVQHNLSLSGATALDFVNPSDGWAIVHGQLLRTTDGGSIWTKLHAVTTART